MKLTLIRHGLTEGNIRRLYYGAMDLPLLPDGIEALHALRDGGGYPEAEQYFTSGMTRTEQTFAALYGDRPHGTLPGMQEMRFGEFEGKTYADLKDDPAFRAWCRKQRLPRRRELERPDGPRAAGACPHSGAGEGHGHRRARRCDRRADVPLVPRYAASLRLDTGPWSRLPDHI